MAEIENTTRKVIGLMAKYNGDHDTMPGFPLVTNADFTMLEIFVDILSMIDNLQKKLAILRVAEFMKTETTHENDHVH